jgi:hypothetical protein
MMSLVGPACQLLPNRKVGRAPSGLACWAAVVGFGQVILSSLIFLASVSFLFVLFTGFKSSI